jgi:hypothetical protein
VPSINLGASYGLDKLVINQSTHFQATEKFFFHLYDLTILKNWIVIFLSGQVIPLTFQISLGKKYDMRRKAGMSSSTYEKNTKPCTYKIRLP